MLRGAEEACWAHNPKVLGSKPSGATFLLYLSRGAATVLWLGHAASSASGLVVKFNVAVGEPRLQFPVGAEFLPFGHIASPVTAMRGGGHDVCTTTTAWFRGNPLPVFGCQTRLLKIHVTFFEGFGTSQSSLPILGCHVFTLTCAHRTRNLTTHCHAGPAVWPCVVCGATGLLCCLSGIAILIRSRAN